MIENRINRQSAAFREALDYCRIYGLCWKKHIAPKVERNEITGYYILDETFTTTIRLITL